MFICAKMLMNFLAIFLLVVPTTPYVFWPTPTSQLIKHPPTSLLAGDDSPAAFGQLDGSSTRIGIISTRWNPTAVGNLVAGTKQALKACNVPETNIFSTEVPGCYELPYAARLLALSGTVDAIICVGVLVKGETKHFEYIADATSHGIMQVGLQTNVPVTFGVLTCMDDEQVTKRTTGDGNHGIGWGMTAVEMALLRSAALGKSKM